MSNLTKAIKQLAKTGDELYCMPATVVSVDTTKRTCEVQLLNEGGNITDVNLQAIESGTKGLLLVPKKDSVVMIAFLDKANAIVVLMSEVETYTLSIDKFKLEIDNTGILIANQTDTLKTLVGELIDYINAIVVVQGTSPNVAGLNALKTKFNNLLK
jgi:hypothetical protein